MAFTAADILADAEVILQDAGGTRWPYAELLRWINASLTEIVRRKPNTNSQTVELTLAKGAYQEVAESHFALIRVTRNLASSSDSEAGRVGGEAITEVDRDLLDTSIPGWTNPAVLPYSKAVAHIIVDEASPRSFYVMPGNDGTGLIEAVVAVIPDALATPGAPDEIASYAALTVPLRDEYREAVLEFVLYRAFSKETNLEGSDANAAAHLALFNAALGLTAGAQAKASVKTTQ